MKFIDLDRQYQRIHLDLNTRLTDVLTHQQFINGPELRQMEVELAARVGVTHCIAVANGTVALQVALMALNILPGDEVITADFSFFGTAETILLAGAKPIFVDIDPDTFNLDATQLEAAITSKTKAIMPVSLYGQCADFDAINIIAGQHNIPVIEDAAQSFGATYKGRESCSLSTIGCTSFFPTKPLGCYGDGGACFTNDDELARQMRMIINHGEEGKYNHVRLGMNARFDTLQAAVMLAKLEIFDDEITKRRNIASLYNNALKDIVTVPRIESFNESVYAQYTVRVANREAVREALAEKGIPTAVHYPKALHQQPIMGEAINKLPICTESLKAADEVLSLPFHPYLTEEQIDLVSTALKEVLCYAEEPV